MMNSRKVVLFAAISGALAVAMGAFGAHGLQGQLSDKLMTVYRTSVDYHFWHTLALFVVSILLDKQPASRMLNYSAIAFLLGIVLFCGSLYLLSVTGITWLGMVTPIGGILFIAGWLLLAVSAFKRES